MSLERAIELNAILSDYAMVMIGLKRFDTIRRLPRDVTLLELCEATALIASGAANEKHADGSATLLSHCDERLVAAIYALEHYQPSTRIIVLRANTGDGEAGGEAGLYVAPLSDRQEGY